MQKEKRHWQRNLLQYKDSLSKEEIKQLIARHETFKSSIRKSLHQRKIWQKVPMLKT